MRASNTHFEQIPVDTVKKIAKEVLNNDAIGNGDVTTGTPEEVTPQPKRWREMAQKAQAEVNPQRTVKLVEELITAFDEEEIRKSGKTPWSGPGIRPGGFHPQ